MKVRDFRLSACRSIDARVGQKPAYEASCLPHTPSRPWGQEDVACPRSRAPLTRHGGQIKLVSLNLVNRVTSTVISVIYSRVSSYSHSMTLKDLRLGFSKRCYFERFIKMATQGELLKYHHFLPVRRSTNRNPRFTTPNIGPRKTSVEKCREKKSSRNRLFCL